jgi:hypothetical protein
VLQAQPTTSPPMRRLARLLAGGAVILAHAAALAVLVSPTSVRPWSSKEGGDSMRVLRSRKNLAIWTPCLFLIFSLRHLPSTQMFCRS